MIYPHPPPPPPYVNVLKNGYIPAKAQKLSSSCTHTTCYTCFFFMVAPKYISHENVERVTVPPPKALYYDMILKHLRTYVRYRKSFVNIGVSNFQKYGF